MGKPFFCKIYSQFPYRIYLHSPSFIQIYLLLFTWFFHVEFDFIFPYNFGMYLMLPAIPVRFTCILQGPFCDTGIPHNFYGEKICSVVNEIVSLLSNKIHAWLGFKACDTVDMVNAVFAIVLQVQPRLHLWVTN